jgi:hypothetical protein
MGGSNMRKASVGILAVLGFGILVISLVSMVQAYFNNYAIGGNDGGVSVTKVGGGDEQLVKALRGIRGTSAAYAASFAALFLAIVFGPYRRGEVWAWWALLGATLLHTAIVLPRLALVGTTLGVSPSVNQLVVVIVALLLDVSRLRKAGA